jgi:hypothetical protein
VNPVHFQSDTVEWGTPPEIMEFVRAEWGAKLVLDVCAQSYNSKCPDYLDRDAFAVNWAGRCEGNDWWMNPPYGNPELPCKPKCVKKKCVKRGSHCTEYTPGCNNFVAKAFNEAYGGLSNGYLLLPARTDTAWWHDFIEPVLRGKYPGTVLFWRGRISFLNQKGERIAPAPFPSVLVQMKGRL